MVGISKRLSVEGPGADGEYELTLTGCHGDDSSHWISRAQADALIDALSVRDASGRLIAPPQPTPPARPSGPHESNADARRPVRE